jgi:hypothetical protein
LGLKSSRHTNEKFKAMSKPPIKPPLSLKKFLKVGILSPIVEPVPVVPPQPFSLIGFPSLPVANLKPGR